MTGWPEWLWWPNWPNQPKWPKWPKCAKWPKLPEWPKWSEWPEWPKLSELFLSRTSWILDRVIFHTWSDRSVEFATLLFMADMSAGEGLVPAVPAVTSRYHWPADQLITSRIPAPKQEAECHWRSGCYFHTRKISSFQNIEKLTNHQGHICWINHGTVEKRGKKNIQKYFEKYSWILVFYCRFLWRHHWYREGKYRK